MQPSPTTTVELPRYIVMHPHDNVAIVVNDGGLQAGTQFPCGLALVQRVPQGHKIALKDFAEGDAIVRYDVTIGHAMREIPRGSWIEESSVRMPPARSLDQLPISTRVPATAEPLQGYTFMGFRNADGSVGTRNILAISTTVHVSPAWSTSPSHASATSCCHATPMSTT